MQRFGDSVSGLREFMAGLGYSARDLDTGKALGPTEQAVDTVFVMH
jgi:hypothetical protein